MPAAPAAKPPHIIHYDLKPANILFDASHRAKVSDFGLSKIIDDADAGGARSLELTSQGAGTYWYLPPECFASPGDGGAAVRISNKVDVWSVGVIFYQMLFGRKPFGEKQTQDEVHAMHVGAAPALAGPAFPAKPAVSAEAKAFIKRCLTHAAADRPDVLAVCDDPYMRVKLK